MKHSFHQSVILTLLIVFFASVSASSSSLFSDSITSASTQSHSSSLSYIQFLTISPVPSYDLPYTDPDLSIAYTIHNYTLWWSKYSLMVNASCHGYAEKTQLELSEMTPSSETFKERFYLSDEIRKKCKGHTVMVDIWIGSNTYRNYSVTSVMPLIGNEYSYLWITFSCISILACILVIAYYFYSPSFRRFPANIVFWRTVVDMGLNLSFVILHLRMITMANEKKACKFMEGAMTQFFLLSSLIWYAVLSFNFYVSITNPFRKPQRKIGLYHICIWVTSFFTSLVAGSQATYRHDLQVCWFKNENPKEINFFNWGFFFVWLFICLIGSWIMHYVGHRKLKTHGLQQTLQHRVKTLRSLRIYVIVYTLYWSIMFSLYLIAYYDHFNGSNHQFKKVFIILCSSIGLMDSITWVSVSYRCGYDNAEEKNDNFHDISEALRYEFISCTQKGIRMAVQKWEEDVGKKKMNRYNEKDYHKDLKKKRVKYNIYVGKVQHDGNRRDKLRKESVYFRNEERPFRFTGYAMALFDEARRAWGMETKNYLDTLNGDPNKMKQNFSDGRSGSFFYFSICRRFMVKTLNKVEFEMLLDILVDYVNYIRPNPESLLCKFYGLYAIQMYGHRQYIVVMHNCLHTANPSLAPSEVYDLKGSSVGRYTKTHIKGKQKKKVGVMKDNNLSIHNKVIIPHEKAKLLVDQIKLDCIFLSNLGIMDYSLLLGIHFCSSKHSHSEQCLPSKMIRSLSMAHSQMANSLQTNPMKPTSLNLDAKKNLEEKNSSELNTLQKNDNVELKLLHKVHDSQEVKQNHDTLQKNMYFSSNVIGPGLYYVGIIDILQGWTYKKKGELCLKILFLGHCFDRKELSVAEPGYYQTRFLNMVRDVIPLNAEDL